MRAVAIKALALIATAFVILFCLSLPAFAVASDFTGIDGNYYYVNGVVQKIGLFYYDGYYYYASTSDGTLAKDTRRYVNYVSSSAAHISTGNYYRFDDLGRMIYPSFGANSPSDYDYYKNLEGANIEHTVYSVDRQSWNPREYPFKDKGLDYKYTGYYTYLPAIRSLPVSYRYPQMTYYTVSHYVSGDVDYLDQVYTTTVDVALDTTSDGLAMLSASSVTYGPDGAQYSTVDHTFVEGVDFVDTCVYVGSIYSYVDASFLPVYLCFLVDGKMVIRLAADVPFYSTDYGLTYVFANGGDLPIDAYSLGFVTAYSNSSASYTLTMDEYTEGYNILYNYNYNSDNWQEWIATLYEDVIVDPDVPADPDDPDDPDSVTLQDIIDLLAGKSDVQAPSAQGPSADQEAAKDEILNASDGLKDYLFGSDGVMSNVDNLVEQYLVPPPSDLADYMLLTQVFTWIGNRILNLDGFNLVVQAVIFVFLLWICGLNFKQRKDDSNDRSS